MLLLFRILEPEEGEIWVDGVNIATLGLHTLRKHLAIIPQDSLLLRGTVRHNLDPFDEKDDGELKNVLTRVGLGGDEKNMLGAYDVSFQFLSVCQKLKVYMVNISY